MATQQSTTIGNAAEPQVYIAIVADGNGVKLSCEVSKAVLQERKYQLDKFLEQALSIVDNVFDDLDKAAAAQQPALPLEDAPAPPLWARAPVTGTPCSRAAATQPATVEV